MTVLAGITTYNPNIDRLKENIEAIIHQVSGVVIIDNFSNNRSDIMELISAYPNVDTIFNSKNEGVSKALNQIFQFALGKNCEWVLTLDQDSVCDENLVKTYLENTNQKDIGILTCKIHDRNYEIEYGKGTEKKLELIDECITSGSFCSLKAYNKTEGFDELMFIDGVDFDYCQQLSRNGFRIYRVDFYGLLHEVGKSKNVRFFLKRFAVYNESPFRHYYIARNMKYLSYKYPNYRNLRKCYIWEFKACVKVLLYEDDKLSKLVQRLKGFMAARKLYITYKNSRGL